MSLVFGQVNFDGDEAFCGMFLSQDSYVDLLDLLDQHFSLNMRTAERALPLLEHCYMLISRVGSRNASGFKQDLWKHIGRRASITVSSLIYNSEYGVAAALVQMQNNFTCNELPHVVIAKSAKFNMAVIGGILKNTKSYTVTLDNPIKLKGRIGVLLGSKEELPMVQLAADGKTLIEYDVQLRPETTHSVEVALNETRVSASDYVAPVPKHAIVGHTRPTITDEHGTDKIVNSKKTTSGERQTYSLQQMAMLQKQAHERQKQAHERPKDSQTSEKEPDKNGDMVITIKTNTRETATGETWRDSPVYVGARGAKYIYTDQGRKKYLPKTSEDADIVNKPVYKVKMLA